MKRSNKQGQRIKGIEQDKIKRMKTLKMDEEDSVKMEAWR